MTSSRRLESEVTAMRELLSRVSRLSGRERCRARRMIDRQFARLLSLIAPHIRYLVRHYGLADMRDDAEQACAIGLHRAIADYDPAKAGFSTFVTWQLKSELQSLRFRMRTDHRASAKAVSARTISLDRLLDDSEMSDTILPDADSERRTESAASGVLTRRMWDRLVEEHSERQRQNGLRQLEIRAAMRARKPGKVRRRDFRKLESRITRDCAIAEAYVFGGGVPEGASAELSNACRRRIAARTLQQIAMQAQSRGVSPGET